MGGVDDARGGLYKQARSSKRPQAALLASKVMTRAIDRDPMRQGEPSSRRNTSLTSETRICMDDGSPACSNVICVDEQRISCASGRSSRSTRKFAHRCRVRRVAPRRSARQAAIAARPAYAEPLMLSWPLSQKRSHRPVRSARSASVVHSESRPERPAQSLSER